MNDNTLVKRFVYIAFVFGMLFIALIPPFQSPDEDSHFKKAYVLAEGNLFPEVKNGKVGYMLPKQMIDFIAEQNEKGGNLEEKFEYEDIYLRERLPSNYSEEKFDAFSTANATPIAHIVPATGILCGKIFARILAISNPSEVYLLYFARVFNLMFYVGVVSISIYITPVMKRVFALVGLMPMTLFQAATASYDVLLIGCAFLATAIICNIAYAGENDRFKVLYQVLLGIIAYLFIAIKIVYLPIYLLLIILPLKDLTKIKQHVKKLAVVAGITIGIYVLFELFTPNIAELVKEENGGLVSEQIAFVMKNPIEYMKIFCRTIINDRQFFVSTTIGTFGLIDTNLYCVFLSVYMILMPIVGICEVSLDKLRIRLIDRIAVIVSVCASIFGSFLAMYLYWTSVMEGYGVGASAITGVQGRYFIPVIPAIFLCFANCQIEDHQKLGKGMSIIAAYSDVLSTSMLAVSGLSMLLRFWC
jgi:hypothetical protein